MYKLYCDIEKELFYEKDYKPLPKLSELSFTDLISLIENLEQAFDNAYINGSALLEQALYDDIIVVKRFTISNIINTYSSGTIAAYIGNNKYTQVDNAVTKTLYYIFNCEDEYIFPLSVDNETIKNLIVDCYKGKLKPDME